MASLSEQHHGYVKTLCFPLIQVSKNIAVSLRSYNNLMCEKKNWLTWHVVDTTRTFSDTINI